MGLGFRVYEPAEGFRVYGLGFRPATSLEEPAKGF